MYKQFSVILVNLDPTIGSEIKKTRPALVISPNEMNKYLNTIIIAPMTSSIKDWPTRYKIRFQEKTGQIALDQIRAISEKRIVKILGKINKKDSINISKILVDIFSVDYS